MMDKKEKILFASEHKRPLRIRTVKEREIITVDGLTGGETAGRFFITPFKGHADRLIRRYGKQRCGTIHTFQGKGENEVYFMTVLNHTDAAKQHLAGSHNLFGKELINVAVSRAKTRFVMVTDVRFFKKYDVNVANLIRYIEAYGMEIPDKTVCLFDYLYRKMPCYQPKGKSDNPFEEKLEEFLKRFVKEKKNLRFVMKLPLADLITDRTYLRERPDIRDFIWNHAHLDYTLYDIRLNLPVLVIELDGQEHRKPEQAVRDRKKEEALEHMEIPLLRVGSKEAWEEQKLREKIEEYLEEGVCRMANS